MATTVSWCRRGVGQTSFRGVGEIAGLELPCATSGHIHTHEHFFNIGVGILQKLSCQNNQKIILLVTVRRLAFIFFSVARFVRFLTYSPLTNRLDP